ncbi:MAG: hypothetical protein PVG83_03895 [Acidimicrobiia bacterium]|jgi:hypothetical protein
MPIYDGLVTLADHEIPVIVELDDSHIRLSASGEEIGEWTVEECTISHVADTRYAISAEEETLTFVPSQPALFAAAVNNGRLSPAEPLPSDPPDVADEVAIAEAPPPRPLTMGLFYALSVATAVLAVWSLIQILL